MKATAKLEKSSQVGQVTIRNKLRILGLFDSGGVFHSINLSFMRLVANVHIDLGI